MAYDAQWAAGGSPAASTGELAHGPATGRQLQQHSCLGLVTAHRLKGAPCRSLGTCLAEAWPGQGRLPGFPTAPDPPTGGHVGGMQHQGMDVCRGQLSARLPLRGMGVGLVGLVSPSVRHHAQKAVQEHQC